jgi:hypothetical protein
MILKLLIGFYRWLWSLPPFDTTDGMMGEILFFGAILDILAIVGIIGVIITKATDK